jgi:diguanylate cyclase (GGDEF)-like protein
MTDLSPENKDFLLAALMAAGDVAYEWDLRTDRMRWAGSSDALGRFGDLPQIASGSLLSARMTADDLMLRQQALEKHFSTREPLDCEYGLRRGDGEFSWVHDRGIAEFADGRPVRLIGIMRQIDERKARDMKVGMSANYDLISGQRSAEMLQDLLANKIATSMRSKMSGAFLYAGIDHMSEINIRYGQEVADRVLFEVGDRLQRSLRGGDVMGRIHGDRFGIVLSNCTAAEMTMAADRFLKAISGTPFRMPDGKDICMTISIGGCNFPDYVRTVPDAIRIAEEAMRKAKNSGRNRFMEHQATEDERAAMKRADEVSQVIINAVRHDNIVFAFQPIFDAHSCEPIFYESLLRVRRPDGSIAGAGEFVPDIERGGRMMVLDQRILEMAVEELKASPDVRLAINISGLTACEPDWIRRAEALLRYSPDIASRLTVEITETAVLRNITECARTIDAAKDLGCLVALDDFGVANITYRELRALAVNLVKIDAMLVRGLHNNPVNQGAIQQLIRIANDYNVQAVAEGIEDIREMQILQRMGVRYLQGFLLAKPSIERPWLKPLDENIIKLAARSRQQG